MNIIELKPFSAAWLDSFIHIGRFAKTRGGGESRLDRPADFANTNDEAMSDRVTEEQQCFPLLIVLYSLTPAKSRDVTCARAREGDMCLFARFRRRKATILYALSLCAYPLILHSSRVCAAGTYGQIFSTLLEQFLSGRLCETYAMPASQGPDLGILPPLRG